MVLVDSEMRSYLELVLLGEEIFETYLTSFILNYFRSCSEGLGIQTGLRVVCELDQVLLALDSTNFG